MALSFVTDKDLHDRNLVQSQSTVLCEMLIITANGALYRKSACVHAAYTHTRPPTEGLVSLNSAPPIPLRTKQCLVAWNVTVRLAVVLWKQKERQVRHTQVQYVHVQVYTRTHTAPIN